MAQFIKILLVLYTVAFFCSIAVLESVSILISVVGLGVLTFQLWKGRRISLGRLNPIEKSILLFNGVIFTSFLFSPVEVLDFKRSLGFFKITFWCFSLSYVLRNYVSKDDIKKWVPFWAVLILIVSGYTILQFFTGIDLVKSPPRPTPYENYFRPTGFLSMALTHSYILGMASLTLLPLVFIDSIKKIHKILYSIVFLVSCVAVVLTLSRGLWIGFFTGFILSVHYLAAKKSRILIYTVVVLAMIPLAMSDFFQSKINDIFNPNLHSISYRFILWEAYWEMFKDYFLLGSGWMQNETILPKYLERIGYKNFGFISHAHSNFIQALASVGALGFVAFCYLIYTPLKKCLVLMNARKGTSLFYFGIAIFSSQILFHVGGLTESNFIDSEVNHLFMSQFGILMCLERGGFLEQ